jgi:hypothetical protein
LSLGDTVSGEGDGQAKGQLSVFHARILESWFDVRAGMVAAFSAM